MCKPTLALFLFRSCCFLWLLFPGVLSLPSPTHHHSSSSDLQGDQAFVPTEQRETDPPLPYHPMSPQTSKLLGSVQGFSSPWTVARLLHCFSCPHLPDVLSPPAECASTAPPLIPPFLFGDESNDVHNGLERARQVKEDVTKGDVTKSHQLHQLPSDVLYNIYLNLRPPEMRNLQLTSTPFRDATITSSSPPLPLSSPAKRPPAILKYHASWDVQSILTCLDRGDADCINYWNSRPYSTVTLRQNLSVDFFILDHAWNPLSADWASDLETLIQERIEQRSAFVTLTLDKSMYLLFRSVHSILKAIPRNFKPANGEQHHIVRHAMRLAFFRITTFQKKCQSFRNNTELYTPFLDKLTRELNSLIVLYRTGQFSLVQYLGILQSYFGRTIVEQEAAWTRDALDIVSAFKSFPSIQWGAVSTIPADINPFFDWNRPMYETSVTITYNQERSLVMNIKESDDPISPFEKHFLKALSSDFSAFKPHLIAILEFLFRDIGFYPSKRPTRNPFLQCILSILIAQPDLDQSNSLKNPSKDQMFCEAVVRLVYETTGGYEGFREDLSSLPCVSERFIRYIRYQEDNHHPSPLPFPLS